jgi:diguanylate cyclase (GGDEF)-like protein
VAERAGEHVGLLFVDLDQFKSVNDTLGHAAGDQLLMITAERIKSAARAVDVAARFGGDEFAVMVCEVSCVGEVVTVAERIIQALGEPMLVGGHPLHVRASIGVALAAPGTCDPATLMQHADIAMYQAKRNGRGCHEVFADDMLLAFADGTTH